jgi:hypothetical protein
MDTPMNSLPNDQNSLNNQNLPQSSIIELSSSRPNKIQKTSPQNHSITIPEFMGPRPTIAHHTECLYTPYSPSNFQPEKDQSPTPSDFNQDQPRNQDSTTRRQGNVPPHKNSMPASPKEDPFCMYKEEHIKEGVSHCKNSIIGKILSSKPILKSILQNSLLGMWGNPKGFTITEIEGGLFHISMESEADTQRIIKGNPWTVRNCWFSVRHWDRSINPRNIDFNHIPTWI